MTEDRFEARPDPGGTTATLTFAGSTGEPATLTLDASGLEAAIQALQEARAALVPAVPEILVPDADITVLAEPRWRLAESTIMGFRIFSIRHAGLGWINVGLRDPEAERLAGWLTRPLPVAGDEDEGR